MSVPLVDVTNLSIPVVNTVPALIWALWQEAGREMGWAYWLAVSVAWLIAAAFARQAEDARSALLLLCGVASATILYGSAMAVFFHGRGRHIAPAIPLLIMCPLFFLARAVPRLGGDRGLLSAALLCLVVVQTGIDTPTRVRQQLLTRLGQGRAEKLYVADVTAVTGDYWRVWPWTFATICFTKPTMGNVPSYL